jgi:hypothetical protein
MLSSSALFDSWSWTMGSCSSRCSSGVLAQLLHTRTACVSCDSSNEVLMFLCKRTSVGEHGSRNHWLISCCSWSKYLPHAADFPRQVVDFLQELTSRGLPQQLAAALLDNAGLALGFSVWVAAPQQQQQQQQQRDSTLTSLQANSPCTGSSVGCEPAAGAAGHAQFAAALMLDDGAVPLRSFQSFVRRDSSHHFFSRRLAVAPGGWHRCVVLCALLHTVCGMQRAHVQGHLQLSQGVCRCSTCTTSTR